MMRVVLLTCLFINCSIDANKPKLNLKISEDQAIICANNSRSDIAFWISSDRCLHADLIYTSFTRELDTLNFNSGPLNMGGGYHCVGYNSEIVYDFCDAIDIFEQYPPERMVNFVGIYLYEDAKCDADFRPNSPSHVLLIGFFRRESLPTVYSVVKFDENYFDQGQLIDLEFLQIQ